VKNWSRYSRQYADEHDLYFRYKRVILLSQFTLFGSVAAFLHSLEDLADGLFLMPAMDMLLAIVIFAIYLINERGHHKTARIVMLSFLNAFFFVYCSITPRELGIYFYYFSWIGLASVIFDAEENTLRNLFIGISIALILLLFITDFKPFGQVELAHQEASRSFLTNLITSIVVLVFFVVQMTKMNDASERKLAQLAGEVKQQNERLEKANRELDRFFYSTSHDLRAPLMSVKGLINLIRVEPNPELSLQKYLPLMTERVNRLDEFIKDIIDYSRNGRKQLNPVAVNLHTTVTEVIDALKYMNEGDRIDFSVNIPGDLTVVTDQDRLLVVLNNLVSNAIKYKHPGRNSWVRVEAMRLNEQVNITVSDNGRGIDEKHIDKIFDMFYRATDHSKGSGLGLYIVKETLEKIGGSITVRSEIDKGSDFYVTIPLCLNIPASPPGSVAPAPMESAQRVTAEAAMPR
jgi:signal transduction histidine kinase